MEVSIDSYELGLVKWFGGYNRQKDRENHYGFIFPWRGEEVFVHRDEIQNGDELKEDELVVFEIGERRGKQHARNVRKVSSDSSAAIIAYRLHFHFDCNKRSSRPATFAGPVLGMVEDYLECGNDEFISFLQYAAQQSHDVIELIGIRWPKFLNKIIGKRSIGELFNSGLTLYNLPGVYLEEHQEEFVDYLNQITEDERHSFLLGHFFQIPSSFSENDEFIALLRQTVQKHPEILSTSLSVSRNPEYFQKIIGQWSFMDLIEHGVQLGDMPDSYLEDHEEKLLDYICEIDEETRLSFLDENIQSIPVSVVLCCGIKGNLIKNDLLAKRQSELDEAITGLFKNRGEGIPEHFLNIIRSSYSKNNLKHPTSVVWRAMEPLLFKKYLFDKNTNLKMFFDESLFLREKIEFFVLANLFPLIQASNDLDTVYSVFLHHLWESLVAKEIAVEDEGVFNLFPSCLEMGQYRLSCEAFYWSNVEIFLCRGKECTDPQVLPVEDKHYLDFNIYDWFKHYGVNYSVENEPSKRDFPVKIAAYFNRLKEIFERLHCRACGKLMKPDRRYARTEYYEYQSGKIEKVNTSAAYRVTVFHCGHSQCSESENKYYINHCIGFGCHDIIDSRDARTKCENGLYICAQCGSCCAQHGESNRIGLCPECGNNLILFENSEDMDRFGKFTRYVECSHQDCEFSITDDLPKKFYMKTCQPVRQVNHGPKNPSNSRNTGFRRNYTRGRFRRDDSGLSDDDIPF